MAEIILKPGREKSVQRLHPWIFSGAIGEVIGAPKPGETVTVYSSGHEFLARAAINPSGNIMARIWSWSEEDTINSVFLGKRLARCIQLRHQLAHVIRSDACRLVHGESDGLPGMILDQYGDICVVQFLSAGAEYWRDTLIDLINDLVRPATLYERSDNDARQVEGLELKSGLISGRKVDDQISISENELRYFVDIMGGQKTGFYLDQRESRYYLKAITRGMDVLDCFSYTGGFAVSALAGGAKSVTCVDSSDSALTILRENINLNLLNLDTVNIVPQDVFKYLRTLRDRGETYDLVILDPPKFAPTFAQVERAARGYKDINLLALKLLKPNGYLFTFSCSGGVSDELFQKIVSGAALDAGVEAVILQHFHQALDHPVALSFPEGAYLKGLLIQKLG